MAKPKYYGSIPTIAQAYQNDPRNKLAQSMLAAGTSTAPVAQGGWAVSDGLARAAQAIGSAFMTKSSDKKYAQREQDYMAAQQAAAALASTPQTPAMPNNPAAVNPAQVNPAMASLDKGTPPVDAPGLGDPTQAAAALASTQSSMGVPGNRPMPNAVEGFDPGPSAAALAGPQGAPPAMAPAMPQIPPQASAQAQYGAMPRPTPAPARYGAPSASQPPARAQLSARTLYYGAVIPNEGGTNKDGSFRTSFKGAVGPGQIMPGTAPEAAKLAGLPYDENLYRTDADYNNALGVAYLGKQLEDFGDPAKALAAYNAGPGAVRIAVRKARKQGGDWMDYLPVTRKNGEIVDTTKGYVERALDRVSSGTNTTEDIEGVPMVQPPTPTMEQVPEAPAAPTVADKPGMPAVPPEVQSNRIAIAQQMLASGNPDMAVIAQQYLDQGLTEQNAARMQTNSQQYGRENMGYQSDLNDYGEARSQSRQFGYDSNRDAQQRNFGRETAYNSQTFEAGENAASRAQQANIASQDRAFTREEAERERTWKAGESEMDRAAAANIKSGKNPYLDTASGIKMYDASMAENNKLDVSIAKMDRALDLLDKQGTGGIYGVPGVGNFAAGMVRGSDEELAQLQSIFNDATLQEIGGSLGVAISDGDRNFVADIGPNMTSSTGANRAKLTVFRQALIRKRDYNSNKIYALSEGQMALPEFDRLWRKFAEANPLVTYDKKTKRPQYNSKPIKFEEWVASRPRFDANGNKVK